MIEWKWRYFNRFTSQHSTKGLPHDHLFIYISGSYGDIFPNLSLLYKVYETKKTPIIVLISSRWRELVTRFEQLGVQFVFIDNEAVFQTSLMMEGRPFILTPGIVFPTLPTLHPYIAEASLSRRISDYEVKRLLLELPVGAKMNPGLLSKERIAYGQEILKDVGCRFGRTVVLAFNSNSRSRPSAEIQLFIARNLRSKGFDVVFNMAETFDMIRSDRLETSEFAKISIPPDMPFELINLAGYYIGTGHGLTVMLATFPTTAKLLLLNDLTHAEMMNSGTLLNAEEMYVSSGFKSEIIHGNDISEYGFSDRSLDDLADVIDKWVSR